MCFRYIRGTCGKAQADCQYRHTDNPTKAQKEEANRARSSSLDAKAVPCRDFKKGNCLAGDSCPFGHDTRAAPVVSAKGKAKAKAKAM